jgi:hypothetical protein
VTQIVANYDQLLMKVGSAGEVENARALMVLESAAPISLRPQRSPQVGADIFEISCQINSDTFCVRFGSLPDICSAKRHVRFTLESGHSWVQRNVR